MLAEKVIKGEYESKEIDNIIKTVLEPYRKQCEKDEKYPGIFIVEALKAQSKIDQLKMEKNHFAQKSLEESLCDNVF